MRRPVRRRFRFFFLFFFLGRRFVGLYSFVFFTKKKTETCSFSFRSFFLTTPEDTPPTPADKEDRPVIFSTRPHVDCQKKIPEIFAAKTKKKVEKRTPPPLPEKEKKKPKEQKKWNLKSYRCQRRNAKPNPTKRRKKIDALPLFLFIPFFLGSHCSPDDQAPPLTSCHAPSSRVLAGLGEIIRFFFIELPLNQFLDFLWFFSLFF